MPKLAFSVLFTINTQINAHAQSVKATNVALMAALPRSSEKVCAMTIAESVARAYPPTSASAKR